ncbi:MAG: Lipolytic protein family [Sphingobacteriales bacterium]|nr:Lipolytic protein family [Sphingobacteriales bacterium]
MEESRRKFIKHAALTGLAGMIMPNLVSAAEFSEPLIHSNTSTGLTFLFQGDSITDGNRTRDNDWNHVMGHGYASLIASRLWFDYPEKKLMFYNRGISGNRVKDLDTRWQRDTLDLKPDVLSILIGVNDIIAIIKDREPESIEKFEETYRRILTRTKEALPNIQLVLCEPFILPLGWVDDKPEMWQSEISKRQKLVRTLAKDYNAIFIELQKPFNKACKKAPAKYWIWDGIHPMPAGHELIAREWIKEVKKTFRFIK